jgi:hypothetical protein
VVVYALALLDGGSGLSTVDTGALLTSERPRSAPIGGLSSLASAFRLGFELLSAALLLGGSAVSPPRSCWPDCTSSRAVGGSS